MRKLDRGLWPLRYMRLPNNYIIIYLYNQLIRFLYRVQIVRGVKVIRRKIISRDGTWIKVDQMIPRTIRSNHAFMYFPGGGFMSPATHLHKKGLASITKETGMVCFMVHYRLALKYPFPKAIEDAIDVYLSIKNHSSDYGLDHPQIGYGGDSAGGNLSAGLSIYLSQHEEKALFQMLLYPALNNDFSTPSKLEFINTPMLNTKILKYLYKNYYQNVPMEMQEYAYPLLNKESTNLPDTYLEACEYDPLKDDAFLYQEHLIKNHVNVDFHFIKHATHGYDAMMHSPVVKDSFKRRINFIKKHIK